MFGFLDGDEPGERARKLRAYEAVFLLAFLAEYWCRALPKWEMLADNYVVSLGIATLLVPAAMTGRWRRLAFLALAASHASVVGHEFPAVGNHAYLEVVFCLLAAAIDLDADEDRTLYLRAVRWIVVVVLFASGLQKLVHGYYFRGEQLAFMLWIESFRPVLAPLLPAAELERLLSYTREIGDGPYRVASPLFLLVSNSIYLAEMGFAALLISRRTRPWAVAGTVVLLLGIEAGAREVFFGIVFTNAVLFHTRTNLHRFLVAPAAVLAVCLVLVSLGILPEVDFK